MSLKKTSYLFIGELYLLGPEHKEHQS